MSHGKRGGLAALLLSALLMLACAGSEPNQPLRVSLASVQALQANSRDAPRYRVDLRVQNPSRWELQLIGADVKVWLQGRQIGSGVSGQRSSIAAFGEGLVTLEVAVSDPIAVRQALGLYGAADRPLSVLLTGSLTRPGLLALPFRSEAEMRFENASAR